MESNNFEQIDNNLPSTLYKYRRWDLGQTDCYENSILTTPEIYFTSPEKFNDPFDSRISLGYRNRDPIELISYLEGKFPDESRNNKDLIQDLRTNPEKVFKWLDQRQEELVNRHSGVFCLSTKYDNILLWSHYAHAHEGICVGFNTELLKRLCYNLSTTAENRHCNWIRSSYPNSMPLLEPFLKDDNETEWLNQVYRYKGPDWEYEDEVRLILSTSDR